MRECRDKPLDIQLRPLPLRKNAGGKTTEVQRQMTSVQVFDRIEAFLRAKYTRSTCYDRTPELLVELRTETALRISISNLCRVVLTDEKNSTWCVVCTNDCRFCPCGKRAGQVCEPGGIGVF